MVLSSTPRVCRFDSEAAAESVPAVPERQRFVALVDVALGFVFVFLFFADHAARERRHNHVAHQVVEI